MEFRLSDDQVDSLVEQLNRFHLEQGTFELVRSGDEIRRLDEAHHEFLLRWQEAPEQSGTLLAEHYLALNIPFHLLMGSFNQLKEALLLIQTAAPQRHTDDYEVFRHANRQFEIAKNEAARACLRRAPVEPVQFATASMGRRTLIRLYLDWLERLDRSISRLNVADFPLASVKESRFTKALNYPESLLICLGMKSCDQILENHRLIRQKASLLYTMLVSSRFEPAFLLYHEIRTLVAELINLLGTLYYEAQTNRVQTFFDFLHALLHMSGDHYLCVVNLRSLTQLNRVHGIETGDRALELVHDCLETLMQKNREWLAYVKGIAGDFYLLCQDVQREQVERLLAEISQCIEELNRDHDLPQPINAGMAATGLRYLRDLTTENMHLVVRYLNEVAATQARTIEDEQSQAERLVLWIKEHYRRTVDLKQRIDPAHVDVFVQPLVRLGPDGALHAFEVLGRLREEDGHLNADLFIDDIARLGLIERFDALVLESLTAHAADIRALTGRLFINVSALTLRSEHYLQVLDAARKGPLEGIDIVLELTEHMLLDNLERVLELHEAHDLAFAIDDFGTGYSSLQTVIELALKGGIEYLKIDGTLVTHLKPGSANEKIVRIIQKMAAELALRTVAEYVETLDQAELLEKIEVDFGQGYLLGLPDTPAAWRGKIAYLDSRMAIPTERKLIL